MTLAAQVKFVEELGGIAPEIQQKGTHREGMTEKLIRGYEIAKKVYDADYLAVRLVTGFHATKIEAELNSYVINNKIEYSEQDVSDLVEYLNMNDFDDETEKMGVYVGSLISILTEKNEKLGKRTIIKIPENRLDYLGEYCRKFDVIKVGVNYGTEVFRVARKGNLLYVEDCKGNSFAQDAGCINGDVKTIVGVNVSGDWFAKNASQFNGKVGVVAGMNVSGSGFARIVGEDGERVEAIIGVNVTGNNFAFGAEFKDGPVGKILYNSREADIGYNRVIEGLNREYNLGLKKVKVRKERSES
ncbi:MAG: hypothetical protein PHC66_04975 [Candidatus Nanoarchaeia archaeon]|nr:hypothetical protein [Candidatus Nanoarchaeia archaeon]MDD5238895.1 hypothetical protein [Candidatus Nanoarchaeia archaeon]